MISQEVQNPGRTPRDHLSSHARRSPGTGRPHRRAAGGRAAPPPDTARQPEAACFWQVVPGLRWFRDRTAIGALARDHAVSRATAYRYVDEVIEVLAAEVPELPTVLEGPPTATAGTSRASSGPTGSRCGSRPSSRDRSTTSPPPGSTPCQPSTAPQPSDCQPGRPRIPGRRDRHQDPDAPA